MSCSISFINRSSLSDSDKNRFEDMINSQNFKSIKEKDDYEKYIQSQFFDTGHFESDEEFDYFVYNDKYYVYKVINGVVQSTAPTDIKNYILNHYNKVKPDNSTTNRYTNLSDYIRDNKVYQGDLSIKNGEIQGVDITKGDTSYLEEGDLTREEALKLYQTIKNNPDSYLERVVFSKYLAIKFIENLIDKDGKMLLYSGQHGNLIQSKSKIILTDNNIKTNPFYQHNNSIIIGLAQLENLIDIYPSFESIENIINVAATEEAIHLTAEFLTTKEDIDHIYDEISDVNKKMILDTYGADFLSKDALVHEYLRMRIQEKVFGKTTELVLQDEIGYESGWFRKLASEILKFLKQIISNLSEVQINSIVDFIKGNVTQDHIDRITNKQFENWVKESNINKNNLNIEYGEFRNVNDGWELVKYPSSRSERKILFNGEGGAFSAKDIEYPGEISSEQRITVARIINKLYNTSEWYGKALRELGKFLQPRIVVVSHKGHQIPLFTKDNNIVINIETIEYLSNRSDKDLDMLLSEEVIHLVENLIIHEPDLKAIWMEFTPEQKKKVKQLYLANEEVDNLFMSPENVVSEFLRQQVQNILQNGNLTEDVQLEFGKEKGGYLWYEALRTMFDSIKRFLFESPSELTQKITSQIIKFESYPTTYQENNSRFKSKISNITNLNTPTTSELIANIDNRVSFDMNELKPLTDLLLEINPEFKIEYVEDLIKKNGIWGYGDILAFKAVLDGNASKIYVAEEFCHLLLEAYVDKPFLKEIQERIIHTRIYQQRAKDYINNPNFQKNGKPNYDAIQKEFVGKILAHVIAGRDLSEVLGKSTEVKGLKTLLTRLWEEIINLFKGKLNTKIERVVEDIMNKRGFDMESIDKANAQVYYAIANADDLVLPAIGLNVGDIKSNPLYLHIDTMLNSDGSYNEFGKAMISFINEIKTFDPSILNNIFLINPENKNRDSLEGLKNSNMPSFNTLDDVKNANLYLTQEEPFDLVDGTTATKGVETIAVIDSKDYLRTLKSEIQHIHNASTTASHINNNSVLFQEDTKLSNMADAIRRFVDIFDHSKFNQLLGDRRIFTKDSIDKFRQIKAYEDKLGAIRQVFQFIDGLESFYSAINQIDIQSYIDELSIRAVDNNDSFIIATLDGFRKTNEQVQTILDELVNDLESYIRDPSNNYTNNKSINNYKTKLESIAGGMNNFNSIVKSKIEDKVARFLASRVKGFNDTQEAEIERCSGLLDDPNLSDKAREQIETIKSFMFQHEGSTDFESIVKHIKDVLSKNSTEETMTSFQRNFDLATLGYRSSLDWLIQVIGSEVGMVESEASAKIATKVSELTNNEQTKEDLEKVGGFIQFGKSISTEVEVIVNGEVVKQKQIISKTQADENEKARLTHEIKVLKDSIDAFTGDENDQQELQSKKSRLEHKLRMLNDRYFYDNTHEEAYEARMQMYETIKNHLGLNSDEALDDLLYELWMEDKIINAEINAIKEEELNNAQKTEEEILEQRKLKAEALIRRDEARERSRAEFKYIREQVKKYNNEYKETKQIIERFIGALRPYLNKLPEAERVIIENKLNLNSKRKKGSTNDDNDRLIEVYHYVKSVLPYRVKGEGSIAAKDLMSFLDSALHIVGTPEFYETRKRIVSDISRYNVQLDPSNYYKVADPETDDTIDVVINGKKETITYITSEDYNNLNEFEQSKYKYVVYEVATDNGIGNFVMDVKKGTFISINSDIANLWSEILSETEFYRATSGEIYLNPDIPEQLAIRQSVIEKEREIERLKNESRAARKDIEYTENQKEVQRRLIEKVKELSAIQNTEKTFDYYQEAYNTLRDKRSTNQKTASLRTRSFNNGFKSAFNSLLSDKEFLKELSELNIDELEEDSIEKWILDNHIISSYTGVTKDGEEYTNHTITPAYYFTRKLPSNRKDQVAILHNQFSVFTYKSKYTYDWSNENDKAILKKRKNVFNEFGSRGKRPDQAYVDMMNDNSDKGLAKQRLYKAIVEDLLIQTQKDSINKSGKIGYVFPTLEKYATEDTESVGAFAKNLGEYHKRNILGTRNQFEHGNAKNNDAEVGNAMNQIKKNFFARTVESIHQWLSLLTHSKKREVGKKHFGGSIPVFYSSYRDPSLVTNDIYASTINYVESLAKSDGIIKTIPVIENTQRILRESGTTQNDFRDAKLGNLVSLQLKNENESISNGVARFLGIVSKLIRLSTQSSFVLDNAFKNLIANNVQNIAVNNRHFSPNVKPFKRAFQKLPSIINDLTKYTTDNKDALLYKMLNPGDSHILERFARANEWGEYVGSMNWIWAIPAGAEKLDNLIDMYRVLDVNVNDSEGNPINLYDAFTISNGTLVMQSGLKDVRGNDFTQESLIKLMYKIKQNKHERTGHSSERTAIQANQLGRCVMTLSQFLIPVIKNQIINATGGRRIDIVQEELRRSTFRDSWHFILNSLPIVGTKGYGKLLATSGERQAYVRVMTFVIATTMIYILKEMLGYSDYDDDDDKYKGIDENSDLANFLLLVLTKTNSEFESSSITVNPNWFPSIIVDRRFNEPRDFVPIIMENKSIIQRNMFMNFFLKDGVDLISGVFGGTYKQDSDYGRYEKGDNKAWTVFKKYILFYDKFGERVDNSGEYLKMIENLDKSNRD